MSTAQPSVNSSGCCSGSAAPGGAWGPLPHSSRIACTSAETGFHSAMTRSQPDIPTVGTNALDRKVSGNVVTNMNPWAPSTELNVEPTRMPTQIIAKPMQNSSTKPSAPLPTSVLTRQPIANPVKAITVMPIAECTSDDR